MSATSFVTYFQNLGCTISLPDITVPDSIKNVFTLVTQFFFSLQKLIPTITRLDLRSQFMLIGLIIPLALDLLIVWLFRKTFDLIKHLLDVLVMGALFLFAGLGFFDTDSALFLVGVIPAFLYYGVRVFFIVRHHRQKAEHHIDFYDLAEDICDHFLSPLFNPDEPPLLSRAELHGEIAHYSSLIAVSNNEIHKAQIIIRFVISFIFLYFSLASSGALPCFPLPGFFIIFFPYFGYPLAGIIFIFTLLECVEFGRKLMLRFNQFLRRWGLRVLMFILGCLYIPAIAAMVSLLIPREQTLCPIGEYPKYVNIPDIKMLRPFLTRETVCTPCDGNHSGFHKMCSSLCSGMNELRLADDPHLIMNIDIVKPCLPLIIWVILTILIGIPVLYSVIIHRNSRFLFLINVYGPDEEIKWRTLLARLKTTGNFLFMSYKFSNLGWSVSLIFQKLLTMIFLSMAKHVADAFLIGLPLVYISYCILTAVRRPYNWIIMNLIDAVCFGANFGYSIIPIVGVGGYVVSPTITGPITITVAVLPVVLIALFFCCKKEKFLEDDPTIVRELDGDERERRLKIIQQKVKQKGELNVVLSEARRERDQLLKKMRMMENDDESNDYENQRIGELNEKINRLLDRSVMMTDKDDWIYMFPEDDVALIPSLIHSIKRKAEEEGEEEKENEEGGEEGMNQTLLGNETMIINQRKLSKTMQLMYEMLDCVLDGATIDIIVRVVNLALIVGLGTFGWLIGVLIAHDESENYGDVYCG
jgi:hypothetical protein